ncbi:MAG: hypothetical protein SGJ11_07020, partial [Phycisphaerae bacterium]|nr:hypothetical protein [Phycisphaerae bacterium]
DPTFWKIDGEGFVVFALTRTPDCDGDGTIDAEEIAQGLDTDLDGDLVPDSCEYASGDLTLDGTVDAADLAVLLGSWGRCGDCPADLDHSGEVDAADLALLLGKWSV